MNSVAAMLMKEFINDPASFMDDINQRGVKIGALFGIWETPIQGEKLREVIMLMLAMCMFTSFIAEKLGVDRGMLAKLVASPGQAPWAKDFSGSVH